MTRITTALVTAAAALSLAGTAFAASPTPVVLYDAAGTPVAVWQPAPLAEPVALADPFAAIDQMMAEQAMMLRATMQQMQQVAFAAPADGSTGPFAIALPVGAPGVVTVTTFTSDGTHHCTRSISYRSDGRDAPPIMKLRDTGGVCADLAAPTARSVSATQPGPAARPDPSASPQGTRLFTIDDRVPEQTEPGAQRIGS